MHICAHNRLCCNGANPHIGEKKTSNLRNVELCVFEGPEDEDECLSAANMQRNIKLPDELAVGRISNDNMVEESAWKRERESFSSF